MKVVRFSASRTGRLYPQEMFLVHISLGAESTPGQRYGRKEYVTEKNPVTPPGIDPGTVRLLMQRLNHYATPGTIYIFIYLFIYMGGDQLDVLLNLHFRTRLRWGCAPIKEYIFSITDPFIQGYS